MSKPLATKVSTPLSENVQIAQLVIVFSPVSCDSLVLQGLRCEWGAGVLNFVLSLSLSHTGHWNSTWHLMANNSLRIWTKRIAALDKDGVDY